MRIVIALVTLTLILSWYAVRAAEEQDLCQLTVQLLDAETGEDLPGLIRLTTDDGDSIVIPELLPRGQGLNQDLEIADWFVLPEKRVVTVPCQRFEVAAFFGLETELTSQSMDLRDRSEAAVTLKLKRFYNAHQAGFRNANTHVHLRKISKGESNRYLIESATGDGLDLVFVSYLERADDDVDYITNRYSKSEIEALSTDHVHFGHGQEHRHNFTAFEEGYGHVMLLNIPELIYPVSIGPGIAKTGTDGIPLKRGIERAQELGGSVIWCHNQWGLEDIPNWLAGRLHANNIFDGGTHGSFQHSYYRYWNVGIQVPVSTGTDWFIYDFSRVYVPADRTLSVDEWLDQLQAGRSYITNGPLLTFSVDGNQLGSDLTLDKPGTVRVRGSAVGRVDFEQLQLIQDGNMIRSAASQPQSGHFSANIDFEIRIDKPCWLALRTPPPSIPDDPQFANKTPKNEYGEELFSHTSATFVDIDEERIFTVTVAQELLDEMNQSRTFIEQRGLFADETEKRQVLSVYQQGIEELAARIQTETRD